MNNDPSKSEKPFEKFRETLAHIVSVPRAEIAKREKAWQKQRQKVKGKR